VHTWYSRRWETTPLLPGGRVQSLRQPTMSPASTLPLHFSSRNGHEKPCQASSSHHSCLRSMRSGSHLVREVKRECSQSFPRWLPDRSHLGSTCPAQIRPCQLLLESPRLTREVCPPRGGFTCHGMRAHMVLSAPGHHLISVWRTGGEPWYPPPSVTTTALLRKRASIPGASP